jgi:threonylcarbamoyladenosine tRNA methylthiotransferase MtaB
MPGFHVEHFGCRAARADGEAVSERLRAAGHCLQQPSEADVVVVNTCSVTAEADRAARAFIRRAHRLNPAARIVVTGCYAQRAPEELAGLPGVAAVVGNSHKALAPEIASRLAWSGSPGAVGDGPVARTELLSVGSMLANSGRNAAPIWVDDRFAHSFLEETQLVPGEQTRPNLKIQEGCGNRCTFCVIPQTRGSSRSLPSATVLNQVQGFVAAGGNELVLSGINLGRWGRDLSISHDTELNTVPERLHGLSLAHLVRRIFNETELNRLRLSSIEPMDWDEDLIGLIAEFGGTRLARHAHLPLQSGSDAVLRRMHRRYRPWHYEAKVWALMQAAGPDMTLGADVMVGFPGETDSEFEQTLGFVRKLPFGYLHLFPFSPRPGTRGWTLHAEQPVAPQTVAERMLALRALAAEKTQLHRSSLVGRELDAITLHSPAELELVGWTSALTENFLPVELEGRLPANQLVRLQVTGLKADGTLRAVMDAAERTQYAATATSVLSKSVPLKSNSSPVSLASA